MTLLHPTLGEPLASEITAALIDLGLQLGSERDLPRLLQSFCNAARKIIGARYAAADAEVFPVLAQITTCAPRSFAFETAIVIPRSLNEHVGFNPSYFSHNSKSPPIASTK